MSRFSYCEKRISLTVTVHCSGLKNPHLNKYFTYSRIVSAKRP